MEKPTFEELEQDLDRIARNQITEILRLAHEHECVDSPSVMADIDEILEEFDRNVEELRLTYEEHGNNTTNNQNTPE